MQKESRSFNLLCEKWIIVMREDGKREELSLTDALLHAHQYVRLAGELPTQDVAVLRLMLAILHAVFYRVDVAGTDAPVRSDSEALDRWETLWSLRAFPEKPIVDYLSMVEDRFWLFDPDKPFYQANSAHIGTAYRASKLNGEISESSNKVRMFANRIGIQKVKMTYAEAARWLLYVNAYDDTSAKAKGKNLPSIGAGWLGKLGVIEAKGENLFETLMLNFVLIHDETILWESVTPIWELPDVRETERSEIALPYDQAALLTLQSRRLLLQREGQDVVGFALLGGDYFDKKNTFAEQMTLWRPIIEKKQVIGYQPKRHDPSTHLWQEFMSLANCQSDGRQPGVVAWNTMLQEADILQDDYVIHYETPSVQYGDKDFFVKNVFSDEVTFHLNLLSEAGLTWRTAVVEEISACEELAKVVGTLADRLSKAAGSESEAPAQNAMEHFYYRIDVPFRNWLAMLDARQSDEILTSLIRDWRHRAANIARDLGNELIEQAGEPAMRGRVYKWKINGVEKSIFYSAPKVFNQFLILVSRYEGRMKGNGEP